MERDLAQRAGLGWIGKNTCLINPKSGSYFLLAEILLGIDLEPDPPFTADRCGTCTRCIEACPTGCILPNRTLDAQRCIAYLTIENKSEIPPDLRPQMGNRIFGCDVCQMVCPWNRFTAIEYDQSLAPNPVPGSPDLRADLRLTSQEFNRKFKDSPVQRARRRGYLRNVAVALGNSGNPAAIPSLEAALQEDEPLVRSHAEWALKQIHQS
jgi:epoxyqueuosine reductase